jgi:hypothetical protein
LKNKEFIELRKGALEARKKRIIEKTNAEFEVLPEIAKALKSSSMIAGKNWVRLKIFIVGRGRAVHLLAGPPSKKRKLNELSNEADDRMADSED